MAQASPSQTYAFQPIVALKYQTTPLDVIRLTPFVLEVKDSWWKKPEFYSKLKTVLKDEVLPKRYPFSHLPSKAERVSYRYLTYRNPNFECVSLEPLPTNFEAFVQPCPDLSINIACFYQVANQEDMDFWENALHNFTMESVTIQLSDD